MISDRNMLPLVKLDELREVIAKHEYPDFIDRLLGRAREFCPPQETAILLRSLSDLAKAAADKLTDELIAAGKTGNYLGAKLEIVKTPAKYDYEACGDPVLSGLEARAEALKKEIKDRQSFLRAIGGEIKNVDGEIEKVNEVLVEYVNDAGENATAVVKRAPLLEQGLTIKVTLPK